MLKICVEDWEVGVPIIELQKSAYILPLDGSWGSEREVKNKSCFFSMNIDFIDLLSAILTSKTTCANGVSTGVGKMTRILAS